MQDARRAAETYVEATHLVLPGQANQLGSVFGGEVCAWIDLACSVSAMRLCRRPMVTASMDELHFLAGIKVGHIAVVHAQVNAAFRTSVELGAKVWSEDPLTGERRLTSNAYLTFVALDESGRPMPVPRLICETDAEKLREAQAHERRRDRLSRKQAAHDRAR